MATKHYALDRNGPKRLEISWKWNYKNIAVQFDGDEIVNIRGRKELKLGQSFKLDNGQELQLKLKREHFYSALKLDIVVNGRPVPGSFFHPALVLMRSYSSIFILAIGVLAGGIFISSAWIIAFGLVYFLLGIFVMRRSATALIIALILLGSASLYLIVLLLYFVQDWQFFVKFVLDVVIILASLGFLPVFLVIAMYSGLEAIKQLKHEESISP